MELLATDKPKRKIHQPKYAKAVQQHCKNCIYDPFSGTGGWREQVEACTSTNCALWNVRPKSKKG